jgi:hypothetical protein
MQFSEMFSDPQVRCPSSASAAATSSGAARLTVETVADNRSFFDLAGDWNRLVVKHADFGDVVELSKIPHYPTAAPSFLPRDVERGAERDVTDLFPLVES